MKCPVCQELGLKSKVYPGTSTQTLLYCQPFYDEGGLFHHHDYNTTTTTYSCSNGHYWVVKSGSSCWCGWSGVEPVVDIIKPSVVLPRMDNIGLVQVE